MKSCILGSLLALASPTAGLAAQQWDLTGLPGYQPRQQAEGMIRSWGNDTQKTLMKRWEDGFHKFHPSVRFQDSLISTALAIPALATGVADLGVMGREIWPVEVLTYKRVYGKAPFTLEVATGSYDVEERTWAFVVFVHKDNPISRLTMKQLDGIFGSERTGGWDEQKLYWITDHARGPDGNIRRWGQLGLTGEWADKPIQTYGFDLLKSGFCLGFAEKVFHGGYKWNDNLHEFMEGFAPGGSVIPSEPKAMEALAKDRYGITWSSIIYKTSGVKPVAIAAGDHGPYLEASRATVQNRTYPLYRSMYIHMNRETGKPLDPKLKEFMRYILSREGQEDVVQQGDYLPLTANVARAQLARLE